MTAGFVAARRGDYNALDLPFRNPALPIPIHKALVVLCPVVGAFLGIFLGLYLVHGVPAVGEFGWPVVAACAVLGLVGLLVPAFLVRLIPARCPSCGGAAYLRTDSSFLREQLARYSYRCAACGHDEAADFSRT